jgi:hypothetical protein
VREAWKRSAHAANSKRTLQGEVVEVAECQLTASCIVNCEAPMFHLEYMVVDLYAGCRLVDLAIELGFVNGIMEQVYRFCLPH